MKIKTKYLVYCTYHKKKKITKRNGSTIHLQATRQNRFQNQDQTAKPQHHATENYTGHPPPSRQPSRQSNQMTKLTERQQLNFLLRTTTPTKTTALEAPISPTTYLTWSKPRRRAWDRRYTTPNNYFFHYLHPSFTPRPRKWSPEEHRLFLAALRLVPPGKWGCFSLLVPGRVGTECRRYFHRIGRAGFISFDGCVKNQLYSKVKIQHAGAVLESSSPVFLKRSLKKFIPRCLPSVDDTLYKSLVANKSNKSTNSANRKNAVRNSQSTKSISSKPSLEQAQSLPNKSTISPANNSVNRKTCRDIQSVKSESSKPRYKQGQSPQNKSTISPANDSANRKTGHNIQSAKSVSRKPRNEEGDSVPSLTPSVAQDLLTYIPPTPSEYDGQPCPPALDQTQVFCRLRVRDSYQVDKSSTSLKSKTHSSQHTSGTAHIPSVKAVSAKVKPSKSTTASSPKDSRSVVNAPQKRQQSGKSKRVSKSEKKTSKTLKKEQKENDSSSQPNTSCGAQIQPNPPKRAARGTVIWESRKRAEVNIGKQSSAVGLPPSIDCSLTGDQVTKLKKKSVKPLKPILKSKDTAKKRRENGKTVHFSQTEGPTKESPASKDIVPDEDRIPSKNSVVVPVVFPQEDDVESKGHVSTDEKLSDQHEIDPNLKIESGDDISRRTFGVTASENTPLATCDSGTRDDVTEHQVAAASNLLVSSSLENGVSSQLSGEVRLPAENNSTSSNVVPPHIQTPPSNETTLQSNLGCGRVPLATKLDISLNSGQECGSMPRTKKITSEPLHVGCYAADSEKHSFEDKSRKRVETIHPEQSASVAESQSTGTDGELLDMEVEMVTPPRNQHENSESLEETGEAGTKLRNSRRVTGPTRGDRTSISFLMNGEDDEPQQKKRRLGADENPVEGTVPLINLDRDVTTAQEEECEESQKKEGNVAVRSDAHPKDPSEYQVMQKRVDQTRLMLSLFVDMVDPIGEQLGHKHQRAKLLESFDESFQWLQFTEGHAAKKRPLRIPSLLDAAKTAVELDNRNAGKQCTVHVGGLTRYWGAFVDSYIDRLKDMEARQIMEVQSKRIADSVL